jgi:hypothetical protein
MRRRESRSTFDTHHPLDHQQKRLSSTEVLFGAREKLRDRESILSTYLSNLDNNPTTIGSSRRRKKKNQLEYAEDRKIRSVSRSRQGFL